MHIRYVAQHFAELSSCNYGASHISCSTFRAGAHDSDSKLGEISRRHLSLDEGNARADWPSGA